MCPESDQSNGYFTERLVNIYDHILPIYSYNEKGFRQKMYRKSKHTLYVQYIFPPKIVPFMRYCGKLWWSQAYHR